MEESNRSDIVTVGAQGTQLSFHQLQDIYNALTGRTESITQLFKRSYLLTFEDILQLHTRIFQACESYGAEIKNVSVTVYHANGLKEVFSSFDRFKLYNKSNTSPVENINIEYNFIIVPAGTDKLRKYRINIDLPSRIALWEKSPEIAVGPISLSRMFGTAPGRVIIEYIDYAAARHFMTQISEWFNAVESSPERVWLQKIQGMSHWLRELFPPFSAIFTLGCFSFLAEKNLGQEMVATQIVEYSCLAASFALGAWLLGKALGRFTEWGIDRIQPLSYVNLNRGDAKCIEKRRRTNNVSIAVSVVGFLAYLALNYAVGVVSGVTVDKLF